MSLRYLNRPFTWTDVLRLRDVERQKDPGHLFYNPGLRKDGKNFIWDIRSITKPLGSEALTEMLQDCSGHEDGLSGKEDIRTVARPGPVMRHNGT